MTLGIAMLMIVPVRSVGKWPMMEVIVAHHR